jgi:hypothetical protein
MISTSEQARRRRRLNQSIRELIAVRRAVGRPATVGAEAPAASVAEDPAVINGEDQAPRAAA